MQALLFETAKFPNATVTAQVDPAVLAAASEGGTVGTEIPVKLSLHGLEQTINTSVTVFSDGGNLRVMSSRPVILSAADFGLAAGVEALRDIAGLDTISTAVPVTLNLQFRHAP